MQATNFCKSLQRGFKNLKNFEDHPNLKYVMQDEELPESVINQRNQKVQSKQVNLVNTNEIMPSIAERKRKI